MKNFLPMSTVYLLILFLSSDQSSLLDLVLDSIHNYCSEQPRFSVEFRKETINTETDFI